ncbi:MAG: diguanylate cyclase [Anaeromyxobacteraceae bacterium]
MPGAVLLVDDERFARTVYSDYLRVGGYDVAVADSAAAALDELRRRRFDLLITDIILPGADGLELLAEAKRLDPNMEVIVITALDRVDPAVRAMKSGASDYLVKPVTPEALHVAAQRCLSTRALLAENKTLRSHLRLFESCQRISAALEHPRAVSLALEAVAGEVGARGAAFFALSDGAHHVDAAVGLDRDDAAAMLDAARPQLRGVERTALVALPGSAERALVLPIGDAGAPAGLVCAVLSRDPPPESVRTAEFVCSHLSVALRMLGHLKQVEHLAYLDDLTHLYNTRFLELVLEREIQAEHPFTVLFMDLDRFKAVNDQHGHLVGSKLLVEVGRVLKACVRDDDVVARYGGDEYVAVLLGIDSGGALKVAERIRRSIEDHVFLSREGSRVRVTSSIGLASYPEHTNSKAEVLDLADRAMYRGKRSSRNVVYMASKDLPPAPAR